MLLTLVLTSSAFATWSLVAAEPATGLLGGAGTSCVGDLSVSIIHGVAPGQGAVHAQAWINEQARDDAVQYLSEGQGAALVLERITAPGYDRWFNSRQYGVVDLVGGAAGFTGLGNMRWAGDRQGTAQGLVYSVQGNILTGEAVLARTEAAFLGGGCDLVERLLLGLEAGAEGGEGDSRCTPKGIPSDSAFLTVTGSDGQVVAAFDVVDSGPSSPLPALRDQYDAWRIDNPCPEPPAGEDTGPAEASGGGCGCSGGPAGGPWALLSGLVALRRRRPDPGP